MTGLRGLGYLAGRSLTGQVWSCLVAWLALIVLSAGFVVLRQPDVLVLGWGPAGLAIGLGLLPVAILVAVPIGVALALERCAQSGELVAFSTLRLPAGRAVLAISLPGILFVPLQASVVDHAAPIAHFELWAANEAPSGPTTARLLPEIAEGLGGLGVSFGGVVDDGLTRVCVTRHTSADRFAALQAERIEWREGERGLGLRVRGGTLWPEPGAPAVRFGELDLDIGGLARGVPGLEMLPSEWLEQRGDRWIARLHDPDPARLLAKKRELEHELRTRRLQVASVVLAIALAALVWSSALRRLAFVVPALCALGVPRWAGVDALPVVLVAALALGIACWRTTRSR